MRSTSSTELRAASSRALGALVRECAEPFQDTDAAPVDALLERIGSARVVLLGEASHGTSEFYAFRARITKALIERAGFNFVAAEADWPDAACIDRLVRGAARPVGPAFTPFSRFPVWMWRNEEVESFTAWLQAHNRERDTSARAGFHGLDLYSMFTSIATVLAYLAERDPAAAQVARARYALLTPWQKDPAAYGRAVLVGRYQSSEREIVAILRDLLAKRIDYARKDGERFFDAAQNARLVANAERYYRAMYYGAATSWNLRDAHMFETLQSLLAFYGPQSRAVVWAHNSHVGDAAWTEMQARGELNIGQLCRETYGHGAYIIGFGTDHGTVAAAHDWDGAMQCMKVRPAHPESYESSFHLAGVPAFVLHLREPRRSALRDELIPARLERAIGVVYRPETELASHYFQASLPQQFDEFIWFDDTRAVTPLRAPSGATAELPETYPFGL